MKSLLLLAALLIPPLAAQDAARPAPARPKLVVLISIDQFRADYFSRFGPVFGKGGFRRLMKQGAWFPEAALPYTLARTAASHAAIATGCNPRHTGIIGNYWYDRDEARVVYSVGDDGARTIGSVEGLPEEGLSLKWLERPTLGDAMQEHYGDESIVLSFGMKDRTALLLGGKRTDGSYWLDTSTGTWVTSSNVAGGDGEQIESLPAWLAALNHRKPALRFAGQRWERLLTEATAEDMAGPDDAPGEPIGPWPDRTFPHEIPSVEEATEDGGADKVAYTITRLVKYSPFGDRAVYDAAVRALAATELGRDKVPDLLTLGFGSLDWVGHSYGPDSQEVLEMVVALDRLLAELFQHFDLAVGRGQWVLALTADHGIPPLPEQSGGRRMPTDLEQTLDASLREIFGVPPEGAGPSPNWVLALHQPGVTLNRDAALAADISFETLADRTAALLREVPGITHAIPRSRLRASAKPPLRDLFRDTHPTRSGDVQFLIEKNAMFSPSGTDHYTQHDYDRRVPLVFLGPGFAAIYDVDGGSPTDIAPTLAYYLGLDLLTEADGRVLTEAFEQTER
jgi:hypothetical protein